MTSDSHAPTRLARRLGVFDAVVLGLGSMIGAGVFSAFAPAARAAGNGFILGLALAALVAYCNATSSAQLAAMYPESGGTYVYGRKRLGPFWGFVAGWGFVIGKLASCAAMAVTFASHAAPSFTRPLAAGAVICITAINCLGVQKTALATRAIVAVVLTALIVVIVAVWGGGAADMGRLWPLSEAVTPWSVLQSAGFLFFAFAGYARLATLGEEVRDPQRTIPRAIVRALAIALVVYVLVALSALAGAGASALASASAPLVEAVEAGSLAWLSPVVRMGAVVASLGVLLSLMAGVSRTMFAMAANHDLPTFLAAVHPRFRVPHRAELVAGSVATTLAALTDLRSAIGFSSFAVLTYYGVTNAAAWSLPAEQRRWPRAFAGLGLLGCALLALALPAPSLLGGACVFAVASALYLVRRRRDA